MIRADGEVSTSHSGRKTCACASSALGVSLEVLREWLLVLETATVDTYAKGDANFEPGPVTSDLLSFMKDLV